MPYIVHYVSKKQVVLCNSKNMYAQRRCKRLFHHLYTPCFLSKISMLNTCKRMSNYIIFTFPPTLQRHSAHTAAIYMYRQTWRRSHMVCLAWLTSARKCNPGCTLTVPCLRVTHNPMHGRVQLPILRGNVKNLVADRSGSFHQNSGQQGSCNLRWHQSAKWNAVCVCGRHPVGNLLVNAWSPRLYLEMFPSRGMHSRSNSHYNL